MSAVDAFGVADSTACDLCGLEGCEDPSHGPPPDEVALESRRHEPAPSAQPRLRAQRASAIIDEAPPEEIIEGLAWADCVTTLIGESGAGKTFVALDLAAAVSDGVVWHGRDVCRGSVIYVPFEGVLGRRLRALRERAGRELDHLYVVEARDPLSPRATREGEEISLGELSLTEAITTLRDELAAEGRPPIRLLVLDTIRASLTGNEDGSAEAAAYLRAVRRILVTVPGAAAVLVHHAGWQDGDNPKKRERGSSTWRGNVDGATYLAAGEYDRERYERRLTLSTLKVRDGEEPPPLHLVRRRVDLMGMDRRGQPITSCVIERDQRTREDRQAEQAQTAAAAARALDMRVLGAMQNPAATSIRLLRAHLGLKSSLVEEAVARILTAGWATTGKRCQAYTVTPTGLAALDTTPDTLTSPNDTRCRSTATTPDTRPVRDGVARVVGGVAGDRDTTPQTLDARTS